MTISNSKIVKEQLKSTDRLQAYFVGKHGDNVAYNGKSDDLAFLTFAKALLEVYNQTPAIDNQYAINCFDAGIYVSGASMTNVTYTHINAPKAIIKTNTGVINEHCSINVREYYRDGVIAGFALTKEGSEVAHFKANKLKNDLGNNGGGIYLDEGIFYNISDEFTVTLRTDTLLTGNPTNENKIYYGKHKKMVGKIFTTNSSDKLYFDSDYYNGDLSIHSASKIEGFIKEWNGNIVSGGALCEVNLLVDKRLSNPLNDAHDATAKIRITELKTPSIHVYRSANFSAGIGTPVPIIFDLTEGTTYQLSLNVSTGEITIPTNGIYLIDAGYALALSAVGQSREILIYINGSLVTKDTERQQATALDKQNANIISHIPLKKGDLVRIYVSSDASPALTVYGTATYKNQTYCKISKIGNIA